jgi:protein gp37
VDRTEIQYCDTSVNGTSGCDGCELWNRREHVCYAGKIHPRLRHLEGYGKSFTEVGLLPGHIAAAARLSDLTGKPRPAGKDYPAKPWLDGLPRLIFVSDMGDALSRAVPFDYLKAEFIDVFNSPAGRRHVWLWLTKQPRRMARFSAWLATQGVGWPDNCCAGTSVTRRRTLGRLDDLLHVGGPGTVRYVSVEPQREALDLSPWLLRLAWVIQGGESGGKRKARPFDLAWADDLRGQCLRFGVPYFLKQLGRNPVEAGARLALRDDHGGDWCEWPERLRVRRMSMAFQARPCREKSANAE